MTETPSSRIGSSAVAAEAYRLAADAHAGQQRKANREPYLEHVTVVAELLLDAGYDENIVAAALLHDIVEHTEIEAADISAEFSPRVCELVAAMTDRDEIEDWGERKAEHRSRIAAAGPDACAIYAADKVSGVREAREGLAQVGSAEVEKRLGNSLELRRATWEDDFAMLEGAGLPDSLPDALRTELSRLEEARRRPGAAGGGEAEPTASSRR